MENIKLYINFEKDLHTRLDMIYNMLTQHLASLPILLKKKYCKVACATLILSTSGHTVAMKRLIRNKSCQC